MLDAGVITNRARNSKRAMHNVRVTAGCETLSHTQSTVSYWLEEVNRSIEAVSVTSEYPQDGGPVCCCYDYRVHARLQNCVLRCVMPLIGCVMSDACYAEREYLQDGGRRKKADGLCKKYFILFNHVSTNQQNIILSKFWTFYALITSFRISWQ